MADTTIGNDNNGIANSGNSNNINQHNFNGSTIIINGQDHKIPKVLTPHLGVYKNFVGRDEELKKLCDILKTQNSVLLLNGIGGVGKSSLAAYYLDRYKQEYNHYGFIEVGESIKSSFL